MASDRGRPLRDTCPTLIRSRFAVTDQVVERSHSADPTVQRQVRHFMVSAHLQSLALHTGVVPGVCGLQRFDHAVPAGV